MNATVHGFGTGPHHNQHAAEPDKRRDPTAPADHFRQDKHGDDRGEQRLGEHERGRVRQGHINYRKENTELRHECQRHPKDMQLETFGP
jgi:hypothetical protein